MNELFPKKDFDAMITRLTDLPSAFYHSFRKNHIVCRHIGILTLIQPKRLKKSYGVHEDEAASDNC